MLALGHFVSHEKEEKLKNIVRNTSHIKESKIEQQHISIVSQTQNKEFDILHKALQKMTKCNTHLCFEEVVCQKNLFLPLDAILKLTPV